MASHLTTATLWLAAVLSLSAAACRDQQPTPPAKAKPSIVTTIHPVEMLVRELAGSGADIVSLLPPGSSPHTYEPTTGDVSRVAQADLLVRVGGGIDSWIDRLEAARRGRAATLTLLEAPGIDAIAFESGEPAAATAHRHGAGIDPHVWLDPLRVRDAVVPALAAALAEVDPAGTADYRQAGERLRGELTRLDADIRATLSAAGGRGYVAFHNAWRYFAQRYGLQEIGVVEEFAGEEPSPSEIAAIVRVARRAQLPAILVEPQLSTRVASTIASEFGGVTVLVDPLGDPGDEKRSTYTALMRFNAAAFARALGGTSDGGDN